MVDVVDKVMDHVVMVNANHVVVVSLGMSVVVLKVLFVSNDGIVVSDSIVLVVNGVFDMVIVPFNMGVLDVAKFGDGGIHVFDIVILCSLPSTSVAVPFGDSRCLCFLVSSNLSAKLNDLCISSSRGSSVGVHVVMVNDGVVEMGPLILFTNLCKDLLLLFLT